MDSSTQIRRDSVDGTLMEDVLRLESEGANNGLAIFNHDEG